MICAKKRLRKRVKNWTNKHNKYIEKRSTRKIENKEMQMKENIKDEMTLEGTYTIDEIEEIAMETQTILWIEPENIKGIDYELEKERIISNPDYNYSAEGKDRRIPMSYLLSYILIDNYCTSTAFQGTIDRVKEKLPDILKKAIFVAKNIYSFSPAHHIWICKELVTKTNIHELLKIAKQAYQVSDKCERIFLAYLFFEFFEAVYCSGDFITSNSEKCIGVDFFDKRDQEFFEEIKLLARLALYSEEEKYIKNCKNKKKSTHE